MSTSIIEVIADDTDITDDLVIAPLLDKEGRRIVGWAPTRVERVTIEQHEYVRRMRFQRGWSGRP